MFDELNKYKKNGHFFFTKGADLALLSQEIPEEPGIFYIFRLAKGHIDLVYISSSGPVDRAGESLQYLKGQINGQIKGKPAQEFFDKKLAIEEIDGLDIYWFVTVDAKHNDSPEHVERKIVGTYWDLYGRLPEWNE